MSGANIGTLRVLTRNVIGGQEEELWKKTGDQGSGWREARVSVENFGLFEVVIYILLCDFVICLDVLQDMILLLLSFENFNVVPKSFFKILGQKQVARG